MLNAENELPVGFASVPGLTVIGTGLVATTLETVPDASVCLIPTWIDGS
jgi:hypothetical protein